MKLIKEPVCSPINESIYDTTDMCDVCMGGGYLLEPVSGATPKCEKCDGSGRIPKHVPPKPIPPENITEGEGELPQVKQEYIQLEKVVQTKNINNKILQRDIDDKNNIIHKLSNDISTTIDGINGRDREIISKRKEIQRLNGMILEAFLAGANLQREKTSETSTLGYNDFITWQEMMKSKELQEMGS